MNIRRMLPILGFLAALSMVGCGSRALKIGPVPVTLPVITGQRISPLDFVVSKDLGEVTYEVSLHDLPTADAIRQMVADYAGDFVASHIELTSLELAEVVATATEGDFSTLQSIELEYIRDEGGAPVIIGSASSDQGLGTTIDFDVPSGVDLLEMLPEGDEASGYPKLVATLSGTPPTEDIVFDVDFFADAYAKVTL